MDKRAVAATMERRLPCIGGAKVGYQKGGMEFRITLINYAVEKRKEKEAMDCSIEEERDHVTDSCV